MCLRWSWGPGRLCCTLGLCRCLGLCCCLGLEVFHRGLWSDVSFRFAGVAAKPRSYPDVNFASLGWPNIPLTSVDPRSTFQVAFLELCGQIFLAWSQVRSFLIKPTSPSHVVYRTQPVDWRELPLLNVHIKEEIFIDGNLSAGLIVARIRISSRR